MLPRFHSTLPQGPDNAIVTHLRWWVNVTGTIIAIGFFSYIFVDKFGITSNLLDLIRRAPSDPATLLALKAVYSGRLHEILLFGFTIVWYALYRNATLAEIELIGKVDSVARKPKSRSEFYGSNKVGMLAIGITAAYVLLAWFVDRFAIYCAIVFVLNVFDLQGNRLMITNVRTHLAKPEYLPPDSDPDKPFIMRIREIARHYWVERPHLERIGRFMILNVLALLVFFFGESAFREVMIHAGNKPIEPPESWFSWPTVKPIIALAYAIEIAAIGWNEYDLAKWRAERNQALKVVFEAQSAERIRRASGEGKRPATTGKGRRKKKTARTPSCVTTSRAPSRSR